VNRDCLIHNLLRLLTIGIFILSSCTSDDKVISNKDYRLISLAPHITEILFELKAGDNLIAVTDFCRFPDAAMQKEKIGGLLNPNIEKIVALKPTHVFGVPAHADLAKVLSQFQLEVTMLSNETILDFLDSVSKIGRMIDRESTADDFARTFTDSLKLLSSSNQNDNIPLFQDL